MKKNTFFKIIILSIAFIMPTIIKAVASDQLYPGGICYNPRENTPIYMESFPEILTIKEYRRNLPGEDSFNSSTWYHYHRSYFETSNTRDWYFVDGWGNDTDTSNHIIKTSLIATRKASEYGSNVLCPDINNQYTYYNSSDIVFIARTYKLSYSLESPAANGVKINKDVTGTDGLKGDVIDATNKHEYYITHNENRNQYPTYQKITSSNLTADELSNCGVSGSEMASCDEKWLRIQAGIAAIIDKSVSVITGDPAINYSNLRYGTAEFFWAEYAMQLFLFEVTGKEIYRPTGNQYLAYLNACNEKGTETVDIEKFIEEYKRLAYDAYGHVDLEGNIVTVGTNGFKFNKLGEQAIELQFKKDGNKYKSDPIQFKESHPEIKDFNINLYKKGNSNLTTIEGKTSVDIKGNDYYIIIDAENLEPGNYAINISVANAQKYSNTFLYRPKPTSINKPEDYSPIAVSLTTKSIVLNGNISFEGGSEVSEIPACTITKQEAGCANYTYGYNSCSVPNTEVEFFGKLICRIQCNETYNLLLDGINLVLPKPSSNNGILAGTYQSISGPTVIHDKYCSFYMNEDDLNSAYEMKKSACPKICPDSSGENCFPDPECIEEIYKEYEKTINKCVNGETGIKSIKQIYMEMNSVDDANNDNINEINLGLFSDYRLASEKITNFATDPNDGRFNEFNNNFLSTYSYSNTFTYSVAGNRNKNIGLDIVYDVNANSTTSYPSTKYYSNVSNSISTPINLNSGTYYYNINGLTNIFNENFKSIYGAGISDSITNCPYNVLARNINSPKCTGSDCSNPDTSFKMVKIKMAYRPIDLTTPFPGQNYNGTQRKSGSNWSESNINKYITNNREVDTNEVYQKDPIYIIDLDASKMNYIKNYNKTTSYDDFTLECTPGTGKECISKFLRGKIDGYNIDLLGNKTSCSELEIPTSSSEANPKFAECAK